MVKVFQFRSPSLVTTSSSESQRPGKRRRLNDIPSSAGSSVSENNDEEDEYDLPSYSSHDEELEDREKTKSKYLTHVPVFDEPQETTFVTQLTQSPSPPTRIRGPRWKKRAPTPPPAPIWNTRAASTPSAPQVQPQSATEKPVVPPAGPNIVAIDDDDALLAAAFFTDSDLEDFGGTDKALNAPRETAVQSPTKRKAPTSFRQTTLFGQSTQVAPPSTQSRVHNWPLISKNEPLTHHKLNYEALTTWIYPTNLGRTRDYQFNIVQRGLFHNLLVALPTGLGKTFIAATVMLNWFRWTKDAQIIFVAPTKPLVSQQVDACFNVVGIPRSQTTMLTGVIQPAVRAEEYQSKRVFFMTPQTLINDLKNGMCDPKKIVLLVIDEAHRATGGYAYVDVVKFVRRFNSSFRVLALTATPGSSVETVQSVIDGLDIARIEIRSEDSLDIRQYIHMKNIELEVFENSDEMGMLLELFRSAVGPVLNKLNSQNAYWGKDPTILTAFGLTKARQAWMATAGRNANFSLKGMVNTIFNVLASLAHAIELLKFHGIGPFFHKMKAFEDSTLEGSNKYARQIATNEHFKKMMTYMRSWVSNADFVGHPKLAHLKTVVLNHFMDAADGHGAAADRGPSETRIMIFAHYRDSAEEIARVLHLHEPMIRPHVFVGQSGTKGSEGMDQKSQLDVIEKFKQGTYNTLVATSIGEEGLDIGEIDLIVCYDCSKSPIRMLQRMGRTGRKRSGKIQVLLMRGKEEESWYQAKDNYQKMQVIIASGKQFNFHDGLSPRIVPKEITPVADKCHVEIPVENSQQELPEPKKRVGRAAKKPAKKFNMPNGVETGFTFMGSKKPKKQPQARSITPELVLDNQIAPIVALRDVLLSPEQELQLEEMYQKISGTDPEYIRCPALDAFPKSQYQLGPTAKVSHSQTTKGLVVALRVMQKPERYMSRPMEDSFTFEAEIPSQSEATSSFPQSGRNRSSGEDAKVSALNSSGTILSANKYDADDDFIDDSILSTKEHHDPELSEADSILESLPRSPGKTPEDLFYVSQKSVPEDDGLSDDLPDIKNIITVEKKKKSFQRISGGALPQKRVRRRVIEDDESDDG